MFFFFFNWGIQYSVIHVWIVTFNFQPIIDDDDDVERAENDVANQGKEVEMAEENQAEGRDLFEELMASARDTEEVNNISVQTPQTTTTAEVSFMMSYWDCKREIDLFSWILLLYFNDIFI